MSKLSVETEFDKAVTAVATSLADCEIKKAKAICNTAQCVQCDMKKYQDNCMKGFADMDKIRVYNMVSRDLAIRNPPKQTYATGKARRSIIFDFWLRELGSIFGYIFGVLFLIAFVCLVIPYCCSAAGLFGQSLNDYDYTRYALPGEAGYAGLYRKHILDTLDKTSKYVIDVNQDGEINCIDYSCIFKVLWDKQYDKKNCEIVRNKSSTMNHLFIRVRQYGGTQWECIEPQASKKDITKYFMEDFWTAAEYNPLYNIYGETDRWLKEIKHGN